MTNNNTIYYMTVTPRNGKTVVYVHNEKNQVVAGPHAAPSFAAGVAWYKQQVATLRNVEK